MIKHMGRKVGVVLFHLMIWATVVTSGYAAGSNGWESFWFLPAGAVTLPVFVILDYLALFDKGSVYRGLTGAVQALLAASVLAYFVCGIGFLDAPESLVFTAYWVPDSSPLVSLSTAISTIGMDTAIGSAVLLLGLVVAKHLYRPLD